MANFDFDNLDIEELLSITKVVQEKAIEIAKKEGEKEGEKIALLSEETKELINALEFRIKTLEEAKPTEKIVSLVINDLPKVDITNQHKEIQTLITCIMSKLNVLLVGEAGSGKTTAAHYVANILGLEFSSMSVGEETGKHEFFGFKNAVGEFVSTEFYERYSKGGVFLIDELDAGNAGVLTSINSALANGSCAFACGMVKKHEDFICIATANTFGTGATYDYIGRNKLDGATLDRFVSLRWDIDLDLEYNISTNKLWCESVQLFRKAIQRLGIKHLVTTRAILNGEKLLANGMDKEKVLMLCIFKGMKQTEIDLIKQSL